MRKSKTCKREMEMRLFNLVFFIDNTALCAM
jgi:hypothetical protein